MTKVRYKGKATTIAKTQIESKIEKRVCTYARGLGWLAWKFTSPGKRGVPDRIFMKNEVCVFIEFKVCGRRPSKLQRRRINEIKRAGMHAFYVDSVESGKEFFNQFEKI